MIHTLRHKHRVRYKGNPEAKRTIVFGHGFGTDQTAFGLITPAFEQDYRVLLYDNAGSTSGDEADFRHAHYNTLYAYAADLEGILDECGEKNVTFVGHSMSGMIGLLTAIRRPELFDRLVLLAASPRYLNDAAHHYTGGFTQDALDGLYAAMQGNYQAWASGFSALVAANPDQPGLAANFAATLHSLRPDIALAVARTIFQSDHRMALPQVQHPVLLVHTQEDVAVPAAVATYMQSHIAGSKLLTIDAMGHLPHCSAPEAVIAAIQPFISNNQA